MISTQSTKTAVSVRISDRKNIIDLGYVRADMKVIELWKIGQHPKEGSVLNGTTLLRFSTVSGDRRSVTVEEHHNTLYLLALNFTVFAKLYHLRQNQSSRLPLEKYYIPHISTKLRKCNTLHTCSMYDISVERYKLKSIQLPAGKRLMWYSQGLQA